MKPLAGVILAVLAIYAITAIIVFWPSEAPDMSPQIQKLETEKAQAKERAQAAEHRAESLDAALTLARANLEAARKQVKLPPSPVPGVVDQTTSLDLPLWAQEELDNRASLIRSLDENLVLERKQNAELKIALDGYKSALVTSEKQIECLKIAHAAHVAAIKKERWKGRLEGFAIGVSVGYLGGKLP